MTSRADQTTRRFDPDRRQRIIEAALRVIEEKGLTALTFRAVAQAADVPLGSTTYHFADKQDLMAATVRLARERNREKTRAVLASNIATRGVAGAVAALVEELTVRQHRQLVLEHDLYLSAMHNPALQEESRQWSDDFVEAISQYTDDITARTLGYLVDGLCLQSALLERMFFIAEVEPLIAQVVGD